MKKSVLFVFSLLLFLGAQAGDLTKTYHFSNYTITPAGDYSKISFEGTMMAGLAGEPSLPYQAVSLMLPPGEKAISIEITGKDEVVIPGSYQLYPMQYAQPLSEPLKSFVKKEAVYQQKSLYPAVQTGNLLTQYLNGYSFALSTFTPVRYNPAEGKITYYSTVTITVHTAPAEEAVAAMKNISKSKEVTGRVKMLAQNPEVMEQYPATKSAASAYKMLIISPSQFQAGFTDLTNYYTSVGTTWQFASTEDIAANMQGQDLQEKIRNYIIQEYQNNQIEYVLLGGDVEHVPSRGFYCYVISGSGYEAYDIPADIYYSGLDGTWNANNNDKWAEPGEEDALPEVAVARMPFSNNGELARMIHKTVFYQQNPVPDEWKRPYLVGENLYDDPLTMGQDYLELLVDQHSDNGYTTFAIPSIQNDIYRLYDTVISLPGNYYHWSTSDVINGINQGRTFIHHSGHSNEVYMMRLFISDITDANFSQVNGVTHNYTLMYTHGCICGAFDYNDCIAEACLTINNFLVGGVFNSRYGWFNQGTTDGPSEHLHREFISALYNDTLPERHLATAHMISKIRTAPYIALPGEFEPGAQRWCIYDCNALGDPSLKIWTDEPTGTGIAGNHNQVSMSVYPVPAKDFATLQYFLEKPSRVTITIADELGNTVQTIGESEQSGGRHEIQLNMRNLAAGVYFCKISTNEAESTKKILVIH